MRKNLELLYTLKPGEEGTEELVKQFGDALVCVRCWYDAERDVLLKTAEIIEAIRPARLPRRSRGNMSASRSPRRRE